jgi:thiamine-monophosphate kinase
VGHGDRLAFDAYLVYEAGVGRALESHRGDAAIDEHEVIRRISALLPPAPPEVLVSVGDDCAVVEIGDTIWVAASDMLTHGHHFKDWAAPEDVGYKAVAVNVSDVAAMGGTPRFVLTSGGAPDPQTALRCFEGVMEACQRFGVYPLGGDTTRADALTVDVAILGELATKPVLRSGARPGDLLAVTGELGAGAAGLLALEHEATRYERLIRKYLRPEPRTAAGRAAAGLGASAMMDLSDGLASDVRRVCESSGVGCDVDLNLLPVETDTRQLAQSLGHDPSILAATGGEDYELLISAPKQILDTLAESTDVPLTVIGEITQSDIIFNRDNKPVNGLSGWDHFA